MIRAEMIALIAAFVLVATGCAGNATRSSATSQRRLTDLHNISQLQTAFRKASDRPRLIVLVSPT